MKAKPINDLFEFRFHFHFDDSVSFSDKYFMAENYRQAREMFDYACSKKDANPLVEKVEKWNRWAERWELLDLTQPIDFLN